MPREGVTRAERLLPIGILPTPKEPSDEAQAAFLEFVLAQYVAEGEDELQPDKLPEEKLQVK